MFLKKNIIQHQQNIEKLIIDYKLLKKAMNLLYKKRIIKAGGINMEWWKKSVVYQIYVKSFQDSNNDGVGDLQGIISRLDYLKILGVDVLWLTPIFKSPNDDNGYDISDYRSIQSEFGTMSDFEELLDKAHQKDIKIILDLVFNHTSDEHFWFQESKKSKNNPYRDYYIWKEENEGDVPNNWTSCFQGSAWELDEKTNEYYLHLFSKKQPDLNWQNPKVRQECIDIMNYWVDKGVDGFRLDVINLISKDESQYYVDSTIKGHQVCANGPHIHEYIQEMNQKVFSRKELLTVGETPAVTIEDAKKYAPLDNKELSMVFQFELMNVDGAEVNKWTDQRFSLKDLKQIMSRWQVGMYQQAWNSLFWNNHDQPRCVSRFGDTSSPLCHEKSAKMLAICLHMMQGTPYIYQGEELGMTNVPFQTIDEFPDIETQNIYQERLKAGFTEEETMYAIRAKARDNARTPMQWNAEKNAGFTEGTPWYRVNPNYKEINVEQALADPESVFYHYQKLIQLRKEHEVMVYGTYQLLFPEDEDLYIYTRTLEEEKWLIVCNFHEKTRKLQCKRAGQVMLSNYADTPAAEKITELRPYEAVIYQMESWDANHGERGRDHSSDFEADIELV